jgi:hypothetical protein
MTMSIAATWHASKAIEAIGPRCHFARAVVMPVVMGDWPYQQTNEVEFKYLKSQITLGWRFRRFFVLRLSCFSVDDA